MWRSRKGRDLGDFMLLEVKKCRGTEFLSFPTGYGSLWWSLKLETVDRPLVCHSGENKLVGLKQIGRTGRERNPI